MMRQIRTAILVNAADFKCGAAALVYSVLRKSCEVRIFRVFGDFTSPFTDCWLKKTRNLPMQYEMAPENTPGKPTADLAIALDAMDLLFTNEIDMFCLCSAGSDFSRLARKLQGYGKEVIGIGLRDSCRASAVSCRNFIDVNDLMADHGAGLAAIAGGETAPSFSQEPAAAAENETRQASGEGIISGQAAAGINAPGGAAGNSTAAASGAADSPASGTAAAEQGGAAGREWTAPVLPPPFSNPALPSRDEMERILRKVFRRLSRMHNGSVSLSDLGGEIRVAMPGFRCADYGFAKFSDLVRSFSFLKLTQRPDSSISITLNSAPYDSVSGAGSHGAGAAHSGSESAADQQLPAPFSNPHLPSRSQMESIVRKLYRDIRSQRNEVYLGDLAGPLKISLPGFMCTDYGFEKFIDLIRALGCFELEPREIGGILVTEKTAGPDNEAAAVPQPDAGAASKEAQESPLQAVSGGAEVQPAAPELPELFSNPSLPSRSEMQKIVMGVFRSIMSLRNVVYLGDIAGTLKIRLPDFRSTDYGFEKFIDFIRALDCFELEPLEIGGILVREKAGSPESDESEAPQPDAGAASQEVAERLRQAESGGTEVQPAAPELPEPFSNTSLPSRSEMQKIVMGVFRSIMSLRNVVYLGDIAGTLKIRLPDFRSTDYGFEKFIDFIRALGCFELEPLEIGGILVREKAGSPESDDSAVSRPEDAAVPTAVQSSDPSAAAGGIVIQAAPQLPEPFSNPQFPSKGEMEKILKRIFRNIAAGRKYTHTPVFVSDVAGGLKAAMPGFRCTDYGFGKFLDFMKSFDCFELRPLEAGGIVVRMKVCLHGVMAWKTRQMMIKVCRKLLDGRKQAEVTLGDINQELCIQMPGFSCRRLGFQSFADFLGSFSFLKLGPLNGTGTAVTIDRSAMYGNEQFS